MSITNTYEMSGKMGVQLHSDSDVQKNKLWQDRVWWLDIKEITDSIFREGEPFWSEQRDGENEMEAHPKSAIKGIV